MDVIQRASTTPFLVKLWQMLSDDGNLGIIAWDESGRNFEVKRPDEMAKILLPQHFRHNNYSSFQRQLNYFGFRKVGRGKQGCLYMHELFSKDRPEDVPKIRRKTNPGKTWAAALAVNGDDQGKSDKVAAQLMSGLKSSNSCKSQPNGKLKRRRFNNPNALAPGLHHVQSMDAMSSMCQSPQEEAAEALFALTSPRPSPMHVKSESVISGLTRSQSCPSFKPEYLAGLAGAGGSQTNSTDDSEADDTSDGVHDAGAESSTPNNASNGYGQSFGYSHSFGHDHDAHDSLVQAVTAMQQRLCGVEKDIQGMKEVLENIVAAVGVGKTAPNSTSSDTASMDTGENDD